MGRVGKIEKWIEEETKKNGKHFDEVLYFNLYTIREMLRKDYDFFMVFDGNEGHGKSRMSINVCRVIDPTFNLSKVCFTTAEFLEALGKAKKREAILFDEAGTNLYSREAMSKMNRLLNKVFMIMRQKNLFIAFCIPNFFMLDSYIRDHRINSLIHISARGKYGYWNRHKTRALSIKASKYKNHSAIKPNFLGHFNKPMHKNIPLNEYLKSKTNHMGVFLDDLKDDFDTTPDLVSLKNVVKRIDYSHRHLLIKIKRGDILGKKIGNKWFVPKKELNKLLSLGKCGKTPKNETNI